MTRTAFTLPALLLAASAGFAQDMPLFTFVPDGSTWRKEDGGSKPRKAPPAGPYMLIDGRLIARVPEKPGSPQEVVRFGHEQIPFASAIALSPDGGTLYVAPTSGRAVWAYVVGKDGGLSAPAPYCPLRVQPGEETLAMTGLTVDADGRVYAATPDGIQVFDPTGRLSGVLALPAKGRPGSLAWDGESRDRLAVWVGDVKYTRPMDTTGVR